jgi:hypothetical protein
MRARMTKLVAGLAAVAALAVGGATLASAAAKAPSANPPVAAVDSDTLQEGDQSAPETATSEKQSSESAASEESVESSSEVAADDGPGGHADEPGNASADNQFQGVQ